MGWLCGVGAWVGVFGFIECSHSLPTLHSDSILILLLPLIIIIIIIIIIIKSVYAVKFNPTAKFDAILNTIVKFNQNPGVSCRYL